jgi:hypothetical protein
MTETATAMIVRVNSISASISSLAKLRDKVHERFLGKSAPTFYHADIRDR